MLPLIFTLSEDITAPTSLSTTILFSIFKSESIVISIATPLLEKTLSTISIFVTSSLSI